ncbi:DUF2179 domain-containing protein [Vagococcus hydrophili]|uniref:UPF0316 protein G7082_00380 n=2 Tax=Vagococcus hydrophili TaxID=2714947 RepID=A0A6G8AQ44_9ENTE|nr:DUF2179 domain-containing protein [Vagococcus hydrophili]QIL47089.1 DUF2179 domain-containing protein [Vagococcus hydrophili]
MDWSILIQIFVINFCYVTLSTLRFMLTMKGYRIVAPLVSMAEITIYIVGLSLVLDHVDQPLNIFIYALGYAVGVSVGIKIEDYLALGYIMVTVIVPDDGLKPNFTADLRDNGFGVTKHYGEGKDGQRLVLEILSPRKNERRLYRLIKELDERAFIISHEPKYISGGFWTKKIKRHQSK